jgi:UDPglucose 6-dehydrogenase
MNSFSNTRIAFLGLGKLGMPVAVSLARNPSFYVTGYDVNPALMSKENYPHRELGPKKTGMFQDWLSRSTIQFAATIPDAVDGADFIFMAIQTPHKSLYEGATTLPAARVDFDYAYLKQCAETLAACVQPDQIVVIISTVLPGTIRREILPVLKGRCRVVYNPFFIAMGTVMHDVDNPEFVLLGGDDKTALLTVKEMYRDFYNGINRADTCVHCMSLESAELTKVAYNTFISAKIAFANTLMEICHKVGANVDSVTGALATATDRLISPKYLTAGMGDGGGCHPRDNIAMSHLARKLNLSYDLFECLMTARQQQASWLVDLLCESSLPKAIFGLSFKPETNITTGSPSLLCMDLLSKRGVQCLTYDPFIDTSQSAPDLSKPHIILIGTKHQVFADNAAVLFPAGSTVIDPHRYIPQLPGVNVVWIGGNHAQS